MGGIGSRRMRHGAPGLSCSQGFVPHFSLPSRHHFVTLAGVVFQILAASFELIYSPISSLSFYVDFITSRISGGGLVNENSMRKALLWEGPR